MTCGVDVSPLASVSNLIACSVYVLVIGCIVCLYVKCMHVYIACMCVVCVYTCE